MQTKYNIIGLMSGTSLDGVDLAHIEFDFIGNKWNFQLFECETIRYSEKWFDQLKNAVNFSKTELTNLNKEYTNLLGFILKNFIEKHNISKIDAVCSHGHTILHQPENGLTLQIGNLPEIATIINQKVVCDFRVQDVFLGGQGAPLVPIGDKILFSEYDYCLNLGGFSNISFDQNNKRVAFDISPVNTVLNFYANQLGLEFDDKGNISKSGIVNLVLLDELNAIDFYQKKHPKSLGFEFVKTLIFPIMDKYLIDVNDKMRTFVEHIAYQIKLALPVAKGRMIVSGGGVYNDFLIEQIKNKAPELEIYIPDYKILEYKEALIFGLLGVLRLRNEINVLASVTGASNNHSSGKIYNAF
jgi:anhydro-N-acetylmuramic acid kinase